jgi:hypothetical protein
LEDQLGKSNSSKLQIEAALRELEVKAEVLRRDKVLLLEELEKGRKHTKDVEEHNSQKLQRVEASYKSKIASIEHAKDEEMLEKTRRFEDRIRGLDHDKQKVEEVGIETLYKCIQRRIS